jgi:hypothetical protein
MRLHALLIPLLIAAASQAAEVTRVIKLFDFEERQAGNAEELPRDWVKIEGPGLPHYVNGRLEAGHAAGGRYAFRFDLDGGSLIYRYPAGHIAVRPGVTYRVNTAVQTDPLPNARARMTLYFADVDGRPIKRSTRHSEPYTGPAGVWGSLSIEAAAPAEAKWMVLELGFVQPAIWRDTTLGKQSLFDQDISGTARFDNLAVSQVPVIDVTCPKPGNVYLRSEPMTLHVSVIDRVTDDLSGQLVVTNAAGKSVFQQTGALELTTPAGGSAMERTGTLTLPDLPPGAYQATLSAIVGNVILGQHTVDLVRLADDEKRIRPDPRFGFVATDVPIEAWPQLPGLLANLGAARVKLAVWGEHNDIDSAERGMFPRLLEDLRQLQITPTACIAALPPRLAAEAGGSSLDRLLRAKPESWQPQLAFMVSRYAGYLDRWQFGADAQAPAFVNDPKHRAAYAAVLGEFRKLLDRTDLAMPWPAWFDMSGELPPAVALSVPPDILPNQLPLYVRDLKASTGQQLSLSLQQLPRLQYGRDAQVRDLVLRVAYALSSGVDRIDLPLPVKVSARENGQIEYQPDESLLVVRTILSTLGNATYKGRVPVAEDVEAMLFDRNGEGVMLLWAKSDHAAPQPAQIVLGNRPQRVDLNGTVSPVLQPKDANGLIEVATGSMPFFLIGVDGLLAQLRCSFAFDNPLLEASFKPQVRRLRFTNPYPYSVSGRIRLIVPAGWSVTALKPDFALAPGETYDAPVTIEFPYNSFAGEKAITCDVTLQAQRTQQFKVPLPIKLGLGDIGLDTIALRDKGDLIIQQVITNYGDKPANYTAFISCPGQPRQERLLVNLRPGSTTIKKYRIPNVDPAPNLRFRSGVKETEGNRILNNEVVVQ